MQQVEQIADLLILRTTGGQDKLQQQVEKFHQPENGPNFQLDQVIPQNYYRFC
jgi:hypothetical protein